MDTLYTCCCCTQRLKGGISCLTQAIGNSVNLDIWDLTTLKILNWERHKAVILPDVALQNVGAGTEHSLKTRPVKLDTLELANSGDCGSTGTVQHEGNLPEVVWRSEHTNFLAIFSLLSELGHRCIPTKCQTLMEDTWKIVQVRWWNEKRKRLKWLSVPNADFNLAHIIKWLKSFMSDFNVEPWHTTIFIQYQTFQCKQHVTNVLSNREKSKSNWSLTISFFSKTFLPINNYEEVISWFSLLHHIGSIFKGSGLQGISDCKSLPLVKVFWS